MLPSENLVDVITELKKMNYSLTLLIEVLFFIFYLNVPFANYAHVNARD